VGAAEALGGSSHDRLKDALGVFIELIVPDVEDGPTFVFEEAIAADIVRTFCMLPAVSSTTSFA